jgi:peptidase M28-like protein
VLIAVFVAQAMLFAGLIIVAVNGFPLVTGGAKEAAPGTRPEQGFLSPATVPSPKVDRFDADRAFREVKFQVELGPRPAGSPVSRRLAEHLRQRLPEGRFEEVPGGLRNVVGRLPGRRPAILVGAHYDTKDIRGFVGAEDTGSGSATLLALARALRRAKGRPGGREREVRFVFFDGKESPRNAPPGSFFYVGLRGSKAYLDAHPGEVDTVIVLDLVGQKDLSFAHESGSHPDLWEQLRSAARRVGTLRLFPDQTVPQIIDDHTPFADAGIRAIDVIDLEYPHFHTVQDTLDKVSARSLDATGETVTELVLGLRRR